VSVFGPLFLLVGFFAAGAFLLLGVGWVRDAAEVVRAAGIATFLGWAATATVLSFGVIAGVAPTLVTAVGVWVVLGIVGVGASRYRAEAERPALRETHDRGRLLAAAGAAVLVVYLLALLVRSWEPTGVLHADVWNQWLPKAKMVYFFGGLDTGVGGLMSLQNPDYPPLDATSEALAFHAIGAADPLDLARLHWALDASFLFGVAWLLSPRVRPAILWPSIAMFALLPGFGSLLGSSLADEPLAMLVGMSGLTALLWLLEDDWRYAGVCGLLLAAATLTKNEGLMLSLIVVVALASTAEGRRRWRALVVLLAIPIVVYGIWKLWLMRQSIPPNPFYDLSDLLRPGYMLSRVDRLDYGLTQLVEALLTPSRWLFLVPCTLVLALVLARRMPGVSIFVCTVIVLVVLGFATVYWISAVDLHFYVDNTVARLPAFVVFFCGAVFPLLLAEVAREQ
jgi:hypothetical protein